MIDKTQKRKRTIYMFDGGQGRRYIGQTVDIEKRKSAHRAECKRGERKALYNAVRKHPDGWTAFPLRVLMEGDWTDFQANAVEVWFIAFHNTYRDGLNETVGGGGVTGFSPTQETRDGISAKLKGRPLSPETTKKMSIAHTGKVKSLEHRKALSKANMGKSPSDETRKKMSKSHLGKSPSPETIEKMREAQRGEKNHFYGKHHSPETIEKLRALAIAREARKRHNPNQTSFIE